MLLLNFYDIPSPHEPSEISWSIQYAKIVYFLKIPDEEMDLPKS